MRVLGVLGFLTATISVAGAEVTFHRDVAPILQRRCEVCHRPGEIGPMPLITFPQVRPWAKAIREAVRLRTMPPWFADPAHGQFGNNPSLTSAEIAAIGAWVEAGMPEGNPKQAPARRQWPEGWTAAAPDLVFAMPRPFPVPANQTIEYQYIILPTRFQADRWVRSIEIRPSDRSVVHHAVLYVREPGSEWLRDVKPGVMFTAPPAETEEGRKARQTKSDILAIYAPGAAVWSWPEGMGKQIPAGSDLVLQMHYTSGSKATEDQTEIGMRLSPEPPKLRVLTIQIGSDLLLIPPGTRNYRISRSGTLPRDALLLSFFPHMHLRGVGFEYQIAGTEGRVETLLKVTNYDFHWQLTYQLQTPRMLPAGTRLLCTGFFDNSANNPRNPDPSAEVSWGEQSWEEMMIGFFEVAVPANIDKQKFFLQPQER